MDNPRLDILPPAQRRVWDLLDEVPGHFVLYGGTALALWLGHRVSVDFDFFTNQEFDPDEMFSRMGFLENGEIEDQKPDWLDVTLPLPEGIVRFNFAGAGFTKGMRSIHAPSKADNGVCVASVDDIFGCKLMAIEGRPKQEDYIDVDAILRMTDCTIADGLAFAMAIHGNRFAPILLPRPLAHFGDLDPPLPPDVQDRLVATARDAREALERGRLPVVEGRTGIAARDWDKGVGR